MLENPNKIEKIALGNPVEGGNVLPENPNEREKVDKK